MNKQQALAALEIAFKDYYQIAEQEGLDFDDMAGEIEDVAREAGIKIDVLAS
jgi:hypothetical protein